MASTHGNDSLTFGHLSYIPNLSEIEPMERYRARILSLFDGVDLAKKGKLTVAEFCEFLRAVGNSTITVEKAAEMIKVIIIQKFPAPNFFGGCAFTIISNLELQIAIEGISTLRRLHVRYSRRLVRPLAGQTALQRHRLSSLVKNKLIALQSVYICRPYLYVV